MANEYISLEEIKGALDITSTKHDASLARAVEAASRTIDRLCDRAFYLTAGETRYFNSPDPAVLYIDDLVALTSLSSDSDGDGVYETTWLPADYSLDRENGALPYTQIMTTPLGAQRFSRVANSVRIVGDWGWEAPPPDIAMATLILATRLFKRKDAPFGIMGFGDLGQIRAITAVDPDVRSLIRPYKRMGIL